MITAAGKEKSTSRGNPAHGRRGAWARRHVLAALAALLLVPADALARPAHVGSKCCNGVRPQDEIVVVDVRSVCGICHSETLAHGVRFETYAISDEWGHRHWLPSDLGSFVNFDPSVRTVVFVHGNQITRSDAKAAGLTMYRRLIEFGAGDEPMRFVIFSWPSERVAGLLQDVRVKAARTDSAGCQLAWLVDQMSPETSVSLVGFSFGARIVTGGLHVLAGGTLCGHGLIERVHPDRMPMNVVLMAAALHAHWLGEGQYHGLAMTQVDRMLLLNNRTDFAMRYYHLIDRSRPQALGFRGPTCIGPEYASKIDMCDVGRQVGSRHQLYRYLAVPSVMAMTAEYIAASGIGLPVELPLGWTFR